MNTKLSVVIPVYQNEILIEKIVRDIHREIISKFPGSEFIVAEDGSTDNTKEILRRLNKEIPFILISEEKKKGYMRAMKDALKIAKNDLIFFMDSDGEQDPKDFWKLYDEIGSCDIVVGYKVNRKPPYRKILSKLNAQILKLLFNVGMKDINSAYKLMRKNVVDEVIDDIKFMPYAPNAEMIILAKRAGFSIKEIPTKHSYHGSTVFPPSKIPKVIYTHLKDITLLRISLLR